MNINFNYDTKWKSDILSRHKLRIYIKLKYYCNVEGYAKQCNFRRQHTIRNQHHILKIAVADVTKGQTDMSYKGELQPLTRLSMRHHVCPSETCGTITSVSTITMLMSSGRSNCGVTYYVSIYY